MAKYMPCADCGQMMQHGATSLPEGQARCLTCRRLNFKHGLNGYRKHGCRCVICATANCDLMAAYRAKRKSETGFAQARRASRIYTSPDTPLLCSACGEIVVGKVQSDKPMHNACRPPRNWSNAIQVSRRVRFEIYERDEWTCQICRVAVDPDLEPKDRMAATLDHIECRSWVLIPDDTPENLRLAHRACNSARGNRAA